MMQQQMNQYQQMFLNSNMGQQQNQMFQQKPAQNPGIINLQSNNQSQMGNMQKNYYEQQNKLPAGTVLTNNSSQMMNQQSMMQQ